jgi:hypothetical protein
MKEIAYSEFKSKCTSYIVWVWKTQQSLQVMRDGEVYVEVVPVPPTKAANRSTPKKKRKK